MAQEDYKDVAAKLIPYMEAMGLSKFNIHWEDGRLLVDLPVLRKKADKSDFYDPKAEEVEIPDISDSFAPSSREQSSDEITSVGQGVFGEIYDAFKGKVKEAIGWLFGKKSGEAKGVFYREGIGEIGLIWGNSKGGLEHIIEKHIIEHSDYDSVAELSKVIEDVIINGDFIVQKGGNIRFEKGSHRVIVAKNESGDFVVTAYDNSRNVSEKKRTEADATLFRQRVLEEMNGAPVSSSSGSERKDNKSEIDKQNSGEDSEDGEPDYESMDPSTAWDALVAQTEGDEEMALTIAEEQRADRQSSYEAALEVVADIEGEIEAAKKQSAPLPEGYKQMSIAEQIRARKEAKADVAAKVAEIEGRLAEARQSADMAEAAMVFWEEIAKTKQLRQEAAAKAERQRRDAEARAEAERMRKEKEELSGIPDMAEDTPAAARARGARKSGGKIYRRQEPIVEKLEGKEVTVDFNEKKKGHQPKARLVVMEASQLQPSHLEGERNPMFFIDEAQPKDRTDVESILAERRHAAEMDPGKITDWRDTVDPFRGSPTVNSRGEVIQGNHRGATLRYMYANEPASMKRYRQYLIDHAADFGLTEEQAQEIAWMEEPVLVNMVDVEDAMAIELGLDTGNSRETGGKDRIDVDRLATGIGDKMGRFMDTLLSDEGAEDGESLRSLIRRNGLEALKFLRDMGKIDERQYATAIDRDGSLTDEGVDDIEKFIRRSFFAGESREFEEKFAALPSKAQGAILAQSWRDTKTAEADKLTPHIKEAVNAFYEMLAIPSFKAARNIKEALLAVETWKAQTVFNEDGEIVSNQKKYSNFALRLAAMMKGATMRETRGVLKQMLDWLQGGSNVGGLLDMMEEPTEAEVEEDRSFRGAVRKVLGMEYEGGEASPILVETDKKKNDGTNGSADVAGTDKGESQRQRGSRADAPSRERDPNPTGTADSGRRIRAEVEEETEKPTFLDAVKTLYSKGKAAASKLFNRSFFDVVKTPEFMKEYGLTGDKFTIRFGVISRHFGKDSDHKLPEEIWQQLPDALQNPFAITKHYERKDGKPVEKGYRIYTSLRHNDKYVIVGADVKNVGRGIEINAIETAFAITSPSELEALVYKSENITPDQQSLLDGRNSHQYPAEREFSNRKVTNSASDKQGEDDKSSDRELTEQDLASIGSESGIDESLIDGARDYINGDRDAWSQMCYQTVKNYVRNTANDSGRGSRATDAPQLAGADAIPSRGGIREEGSRPGEMDGADGTENMARDGERGENPAGSDGAISGTGSPDNAGAQTPGTDAQHSDSGDTGRSGGSGSRRGNVRKPKGDKGGKSNARTDGERDASSRGTARPEAGVTRGEETAQSMIDDALDTLRDIFKNPGMTEPGRLNDVTALLAGLGVNAVRFLGATAKLGCGLVLKGFYKYAKWRGEMHRQLDPLLHEHSDLTDDQIAEYIRSAWDMKMSYRGVRKKVSEWAAELEAEELRKMARMSIEEKRKLQAEAEGTSVVIGNLDNIRETLPFLLPAQHEDVEKAERQLFSAEHADRDHGFGKGYLFTNGTGTGKTYTGLGIAKRFLKQGKGRILIVTVNDTKINDWIKDASNLGIEARQLEDTKSKGKGVVVTQYANLRQNFALLEDEFDLIIYDESHKLMENQHGAVGNTARMHHLLANRDAEAVIEREIETSELGEKRRQNRQRIEHLNELFSIAQKPASLVSPEERKKIIESGFRSEEDLRKAISEAGIQEEKYTKEIEDKIEAALNDQAARERAEEISKKTKTVFLSATPFNTPSNLDYAEGYIFSYPEGKPGEGRKERRNGFLRKNFGKSYRVNSQGEMARMSESQITDPEGVEEEEINFSNHLQDKLQTMSGRMLDSAFDYSRTFPQFEMPEAKLVNAAMSEINNGPLRDFFKKTLLDYNYSTAFWEIIKTHFAIPRIREHIALGRKVVIFHRRKDSSQDIRCPFAKGLEAAMEAGEVSKNAALTFARKYADLLAWEASLDYSYPQDRILNEFISDEERAAFDKAHKEWEKKRDEAVRKGKRPPREPKLKSKRVGIFNGDETKNEKQGSVDNFNAADSGQDIIVVQVQSGKEGISLHDTDGRHQRVMMSLALPQSPIEFIQAEGRIYRVGNMSDAIFEYPLLGIDRELYDFAIKINGRSQTSENLAMGSRSRGLRDSITRGALGSMPMPVTKEQGKGGKMLDSRQTQQATGFDHAMSNWKEWRDKETSLPYEERSIPDPLGVKLMEWAGLERGETVLVAYAGEGSAARYAPQSSKLIALESDGGKLARLAALLGGGGRKILGEAFMTDDRNDPNIFSTVNKADVVVVKTRTGNAKQGFSSIKRSILDIKKAIDHTEDSGRVIAIVPTSDLKGVDGILKSVEEWRKYYGTVTRTIVNLPADIFGQEASVIVIDKNLEPSIASANASKGMQRLEVKAGQDVETSLASMRDMAVEKREVDHIAKAVKRVKKVLAPFMNSSLVRSERGMQGKKQKMVHVSRNMVSVFLRRGIYLIPKNVQPSALRYDGLSIYFSKLFQPKEIEELANKWAACKRMSELSSEEFRKEYRYEFKESLDDEAQALLSAFCTLIEAATGKTATQLQNISEGKVENEIKNDMSLEEFMDVYKTLDSGSEEIDELARRVFATAKQIEGLSFRMASGEVFSGHNVMAHYAPAKNAIELNMDAFNSIRFTDAQKAQCILHETIHAVTCWAYARYKEADPAERAAMGKIGEACADIESVYKSINNESFRAALQAGSQLRDNANYGLTDEYEMLAEMSNPVFRAALKTKRLWRQLVNGIKKLFGIDVTETGEGETTAFDTLNRAISTILENFDPEAYRRYQAAPSKAEYNNAAMDAETYDMAIELVASTGIPVVEVSDADAMAMMPGNKKTPLAGQPNRANEKLTSGSVLASIRRDSSSNPTTSRQADANLQNNTQSAKN